MTLRNHIAPGDALGGGALPASPAPAVEVRSLHYRYPHEPTEALRGVSLSVPAGACVALIGPNGSGKSTLLLHLNGLLPDARPGASGQVLLDGSPITLANLHQVRRRVGLLFQDPDDQLFCPSVFEDVAFGPRQFGLASAAIEARVHAALGAVGFTPAIARRDPFRLSGGEKRRVCLAGVLACDPAVLVLDEPSSGLDPRGRRQLMAILRGLPATKIIATHDLDLVMELCSHAVLLDAGQVVAQGPSRTLLADRSLMEAHGLEPRD